MTEKALDRPLAQDISWFLGWMEGTCIIPPSRRDMLPPIMDPSATTRPEFLVISMLADRMPGFGAEVNHLAGSLVDSIGIRKDYSRYVGENPRFQDVTNQQVIGVFNRDIGDHSGHQISVSKSKLSWAKVSEGDDAGVLLFIQEAGIKDRIFTYPLMLPALCPAGPRRREDLDFVKGMYQIMPVLVGSISEATNGQMPGEGLNDTGRELRNRRDILKDEVSCRKVGEVMGRIQIILDKAFRQGISADMLLAFTAYYQEMVTKLAYDKIHEQENPSVIGLFEEGFGKTCARR